MTHAADCRHRRRSKDTTRRTNILRIWWLAQQRWSKAFSLGSDDCPSIRPPPFGQPGGIRRHVTLKIQKEWERSEQDPARSLWFHHDGTTHYYVRSRLRFRRCIRNAQAPQGRIRTRRTRSPWGVVVSLMTISWNQVVQFQKTSASTTDIHTAMKYGNLLQAAATAGKEQMYHDQKRKKIEQEADETKAPTKPQDVWGRSQASIRPKQIFNDFLAFVHFGCIKKSP